MRAPPKEFWQKKLERSGYLVGAIFFHLVIFLMLATLVIWKAPAPPPVAEFHGVTVKTLPPPPPLPSSSGAAAPNPDFEPQPVVVPVPTPPSAITSQSSAFKMDVAKAMNTALSDLMPKGNGISTGGGGNSGNGSGFGFSTGTSAQLSGYLYDLKQTYDKQPTGMTIDLYNQLLSKYVAQGWDDSLLGSYYKSKASVYANSIAIAYRPSEEAPKAFGLENEVQPGLWLIHYHVRVIAPQEGEYRLSGFGDDVLMVKINGDTVLDAGWTLLSDKPNLHQNLPYILPSCSGFNDAHFRVGPTFHVDTAEPVDMDVIIGDHGGSCCFFLQIQDMDNTYESLPDGTLKLPFFQIGNEAVPKFLDSEEHPPYSTKAEPWQPVEN